MLYEIHRYPADLIDVVVLEGGARVLVRPVLPQDEELTAQFFGALSPPARYRRFMNPMRYLPRELLRRFTHVDYAEHVALVAEVFGDGGETVIAEARYVRREGDIAELAVAVAEDWRRKGLGSVLLAKLACQAASAGVKRLVGETLSENDAMLMLARKLGFGAKRSPDTRGVMLIEKELALPLGGACSQRSENTLAAA